MNWSDAHPTHSLRNVPSWFFRHLENYDRLERLSVSADEDILSSLKNKPDGVIMSGSPRDAWDEDPMNYKLGEIILACRDRNIPFLGVCFGLQLMGRFLGGRVARNPNGLELGVIDVSLTKAGRQNPIFQGFPEIFSVLQSHHDAVLDLPPGAELLASSAMTKTQSFAIADYMAGVQFHPEMDADVLRYLWQPRLANWRAKTGQDLKPIMDGLTTPPTSWRVLTNFVDHFVLAQN